jgi:hypothetical protein
MRVRGGRILKRSSLFLIGAGRTRQRFAIGPNGALAATRTSKALPREHNSDGHGQQGDSKDGDCNDQQF